MTPNPAVSVPAPGAATAPLSPPAERSSAGPSEPTEPAPPSDPAQSLPDAVVAVQASQEQPTEPASQARAPGGVLTSDTSDTASTTPQPLWAEALPAPLAAELTYKVFYGDAADSGGAIASLRFRLVVAGGQYSMDTEARAEGVTAWVYSGSMTQSSRGRLGPDGLEPLRFDEQRGRRGPRYAEVDRERALVLFGNGQSAPWRAGLQDRLSTLIQLGLVLRAVPAYQDSGAVVSFPEMTSSGVIQANYRSSGQVTLAVGSKMVTAVHMMRVAASPAEPQIEVWLGPDQQWLPVRIKVTDRNGRALDQLIVL